MLFLLYGTDTLRSRRKLQEIIGEFEKRTRRGGIDLVRLDFAERPAERFSEFQLGQETLPMFSQKKLIVLENVFSNPEFCQKILGVLKGQEGNILIFFETKVVDEKNPLFSFLLKKAKVQEFKLLVAASLKTWIKKEITCLGGAVSPGAVERLAFFWGSDLWGLSNEVRRLVALRQRKAIEPQDIVPSPYVSVETNIFKTIDELGAGRRKEAFSLVEQHLEKGDAPPYLLAMIAYQFRNLLVLKELSEKGKPLSVLPFKSFQLNKYRLLAGKFSFSLLKRIYAKILTVDFRIKTGKIDSRRGLELLVHDITS
jgi:DNA polymerase III delta subunit